MLQSLPISVYYFLTYAVISVIVCVYDPLDIVGFKRRGYIIYLISINVTVVLPHSRY